MVAKKAFEPLITVDDFGGGLNESLAEGGAKENELTECLNTVPTRDSDGLYGFRKAPGNVLQVLLPEAVLGLYCFVKNDGTKRYVAVGPSNFYVSDSRSFSSYTTTLHTASGATNNPPTFDVFRDALFITKDTFTKPYVFTNTVTNTPTVITGWPPSGVTGNPIFVDRRTNRLWLTGNATYPSQVYHCDTDDYTQWNPVVAGDPTNAAWFDIPDGAIIYGCKEFINFLLIYTNQGIYAIAGSTPPSLNLSDPLRVENSYRTQRFRSPYSIVNASSVDQMFWDGRSIRSIVATEKYGDLTKSRISTPITNTLSNIAMSDLGSVQGYYLPDPINQVWWSAKSSSSNTYNTKIILDMNNGSWWTENIGFSAVCVDEEGYVLTGREDGSIYLEFSGTQRDGGNYNFEAKTKWFNFGQPRYLTELQIGVKALSGYNLLVDVYTDFNSSEPNQTINLAATGSIFRLGTGVLGSTPLTTVTYKNFDTAYLPQTKSVRFGFRTEGSDTPISIYNLYLFGG